MGEVAAFAQILRHVGLLKAIENRSYQETTLPLFVEIRLQKERKKSEIGSVSQKPPQTGGGPLETTSRAA